MFDGCGYCGYLSGMSRGCILTSSCNWLEVCSSSGLHMIFAFILGNEMTWSAHFLRRRLLVYSLTSFSSWAVDRLCITFDFWFSCLNDCPYHHVCGSIHCWQYSIKIWEHIPVMFQSMKVSTVITDYAPNMLKDLSLPEVKSLLETQQQATLMRKMTLILPSLSSQRPRQSPHCGWYTQGSGLAEPCSQQNPQTC